MEELKVSTHSRLEAADSETQHVQIVQLVSTHSRLEAAEKYRNNGAIPLVFQHTAA